MLILVKKEVFSKYSFFLFFIFYLMLFLIFSFIFIDLLGFYILFEISLIPMIFLIVGWGYQIERLGAIFYLMLYTLAGSFPLLLSLFSMSKIFNSVIFFFVQDSLNYSFFFSVLIILLYFSFLIKLPMYFFHLWLPKAHVEAPAIGSIVLAAVILKLAIYATYRFSFLLVYFLLPFVTGIFIFLLLGSIFSALICSIQTDLKSLIAYSSVSHMGVVMAGALVNRSLAMGGVYAVLLRHAFSSSGLFFMAMFRYEQRLTRQLLLSRGQGVLFYYSRLFWILFLLANMGVPPLLRVLGELSLFIPIFQQNFFFFILIGLGVFSVSYFSIYLYRVLIHGRNSFFKPRRGELELFFLVSSFHFFPLFAIRLCFNVFF